MKNMGINKTEESSMNRAAGIDKDRLEYVASSEMIFYTDSFHVNSGGNVDLYVDLVLSRHIGKKRG